jgi:hypothetical protein
MPSLHLSAALVDQCKLCAQQRDYNRRNSFDYSSNKTDDKGIWSFMGVLGEVALLTYFELEIDWEYLSTDKGFCGVDVGDIWEVRAMSKFGNRLFLWSDEVTKANKLTYAWSKVVVDPATGYCNVCGWAMGYEIAMHGVHGQYDCKRSSYFYPNDQLRLHTSPKADQQLATNLHLIYRNIEHEGIF